MTDDERRKMAAMAASNEIGHLTLEDQIITTRKLLSSLMTESELSFGLRKERAKLFSLHLDLSLKEATVKAIEKCRIIFGLEPRHHDRKEPST